MNILIFTVAISVMLVSGTTYNLQDYLKYLSRDEGRSTLVQRKPVIGSAMIKQYFNDEPVDAGFKRPDHYDVGNDPDPIIENLPPTQNNMGFIANLNEAQLHELIKEGLKYQQMAMEMLKDKEGIVEVGGEDSEEGSDEEEDDIIAEDEDITTLKPTTTQKFVNSTSTRMPDTKITTIKITPTPNKKSENTTITEKLQASTEKVTTTTEIVTEKDTTTTKNATTRKPQATKKSKKSKKKPATTPAPNPTTPNSNPLINRIVEIRDYTDLDEEDTFDAENFEDNEQEFDEEYQEEEIEEKPLKKKKRVGSAPQKIRLTKKKTKQTFRIKFVPARPGRPSSISVIPTGVNGQNVRPTQNNASPSTSQPRQRICPYDCQCGVSTSRRIVGGVNAAQNEFPWMVLLEKNGELHCGGSLVNSAFALTAAHCMVGENTNNILMQLMEFDRDSNFQNRITRRIARAYINPNFNRRNTDSDVALLRLNQPVSFQSLLRPICLPSPQRNYAGQNGVIIGWGTTTEDGNESRFLKKANVPILSNRQCRNTQVRGITENMICAGRVRVGGVDSCQGDSGGPLMIVERRRYVQVGSTSFGNGCGRPNNPGVYARISRFLNWIDSITATSGCFCR